MGDSCIHATCEDYRAAATIDLECGHCLAEESPAETAAELRRFFGS